jgi:hypothetical protein
MKEEKKVSLEKKLHYNLLDIIDEFTEDYNVNITELSYKVKILKSNREDNSNYDDVEFEIKTDMR